MDITKLFGKGIILLLLFSLILLIIPSIPKKKNKPAENEPKKDSENLFV